MRFFFAALLLFSADLVLVLCFPSQAAGAGTALRLQLPSLVQRSALIVEARVLAAHPLETPGLLVTEYLLEVARTLKGSDQSYRTLRLPGGLRADGSGLLVPGVPHLAPGEDALLFLEAEGRDGLCMPVGLAQGKFRLLAGSDGKKQLVRDLSSIELVGTPAGAVGSDARAVVDYAEVVAAIEAAANAPGAGR